MTTTKEAINKYLTYEILDSEILTSAEKRQIEDFNQKCCWGISAKELSSYAKMYQMAVEMFCPEKYNLKTMAMIDYRLTDCNFHKEVKMLHNKEFDKLIYGEN